MRVVAGGPGDRQAVAGFLADRHLLQVARRGELVDALDQPAFLALEADDLIGVATYVIGDGECELLTLHAGRRFDGVGTALVNAVAKAARRAGCQRLWVVTTNDNLDALRFYQRRGFALTALRPQAVTWSRQHLKPGIPATGSHGIELRDEVELTMDLTAQDPVIAEARRR